MSTTMVAIALAMCVGLGACSTQPKQADAAQDKTAKQSQQSLAAPLHRAAGEGKDYEWGKDHIFVKLSSVETGGVLTLIQDNLKPGFDLGLHLHRAHTEIFYILDGEVEFTVGEKPVNATTGSVIYLPAGTPHAATSTTGGKMLMFYTPGGFDNMLAEIEQASWFERLNPFAGARRAQKYDNHKLSGSAKIIRDGPRPRIVAPGQGVRNGDRADLSIVKLSSSQTAGLATVTEVTLKPGDSLEPQLQSGQLQILYVLDGTVEFKSVNVMQTARTGATIYFPPGKSDSVSASKGAKLLVFLTPG